jgi:hypothetical protein
VAVYSTFCGAADVILSLQDSREKETQKTVLGYKNVLLTKKHNARPGSLKPESFAGL